MIEVKNRLYIQRFLATELKFSDLWKAVTYSQLELKEGGIPFWYVKSKGYTATTDLKRTWEEIYSDMKSNTRNEVRRAQKEGIIIESNFDYDKFVPFYNDFCDSKGLDLKITKHTLEKYDKMLITVARKGDNVLAMHATVINPKDKVAMLFYSCSQRLSEDVDRKLIGWANRYLHYRELEIFKEQGYERYEWHSLVIDPAHPNYSIGQFKLSFGGALHETVSAKTPLFVLMKKAQSFLFRIQRLFPSARNIFKRIMNKFLWLFCATRINSTGKTIYLTFDDGPEPGITEFVLDELNKYGFKATFFCRGDNAQKYPNLLAMINGGGIL